MLWLELGLGLWLGDRVAGVSYAPLSTAPRIFFINNLSYHANVNILP